MISFEEFKKKLKLKEEITIPEAVWHEVVVIKHEMNKLKFEFIL